MANRCNMRVAVVAGEDRSQQGGQHRARIRRVVAVVGQRAVRHPGLEQAAYLEKLDEDGQLSEWCDRCGGIPFDVDSAPERIECDRPVLPDQGLAWCFTHWVTPFVTKTCAANPLPPRL